MLLGGIVGEHAHRMADERSFLTHDCHICYMHRVVSCSLYIYMMIIDFYDIYSITYISSGKTMCSITLHSKSRFRAGRVLASKRNA